MHPRLPSALLRAFLLGALVLPAVAHAADPDPMSTPLVRAILARRAHAAVTGTPALPATREADPFHVLSTAIDSPTRQIDRERTRHQ